MKKLLATLFMAFVLSSCNGQTAAYRINVNSTLKDFEGKPSAILIGGTYCPHCRKAVPVFETDVWDKYKDNVNIWLQVIDGGKFDVNRVAQGLNQNISYDAIVGEQCAFVPTWIVLDRFGKVYDSSCGNKKEISVIVNDLNLLLGVQPATTTEEPAKK